MKNVIHISLCPRSSALQRAELLRGLNSALCLTSDVGLDFEVLSTVLILFLGSGVWRLSSVMLNYPHD